MSKIKVIVDTGSSLSMEFAKSNNLALFPFNIHINEKTYMDQVDLDFERAYDFIDDESVDSKTAVPSGFDFQKFIKSLLDEGYDKFIFITISSNLSSMIQMADLAFKQIEDDRLKDYRLVDSMAAGPQIFYGAKELVKAVDRGVNDLDTLCDIAKRSYEKANTYGILRSLRALNKGGRIPKSLSLVGDKIHFSPILKLDDGELKVYKKSIGKNKGLRDFYKSVKAQIDLTDDYIIYMFKTRNEEDYIKIKEMLEDEISHAKEFYEFKLTPVVSVHTGVDIVGMSIINL